MSSEATGRRMVYPYTFTAKVMQFPYRYHMEKTWIFRYFLFGVALTLPVMWKIQKAVNSPENKAAHQEILRKEREEHAKKH